MSVVIHSQGLSKKYLIAHQSSERYTSLRDVLTSKAKNAAGRFLPGKQRPRKVNVEFPNREEFWALRNIDFEVREGDRIGIVGRNGAGKSTLLKILSRITEPTTGRVTIRGRVASLLEVGTGFHPELTGRENIFLNGAILGMKRAEIAKKFDDIVAFSEVEKFLDTPVKRYSSGMYVRLAFAVAAHLDPEILILDEVLAVGDAEFQKKCLGKINEVGRSGRTVLFVSHNMIAVEQLCNIAMLLDRGQIKHFSSNVREVVRRYLFSGETEENLSAWVNRGQEFRNPWFTPVRFFIGNESGDTVRMPVRNDADVWVYLYGEVQQTDPALTVGYAVYSEDGVPLYWSYQTDAAQQHWPTLKRGLNRLRTKIPQRLLNEGDYRLELLGGLHFRQWLFEPGQNPPSIPLCIRGGLSESPMWMQRRPVALAPVLNWELVSD